MIHFEQVCITHIFKEQNKAAKHLANLAFKQENGVEMMLIPLDSLQTILDDDRVGAS